MNVVLNSRKPAALLIKEWLSAESDLFFSIMGERFTRKEIVLVHLLFILAVVAAMFAGSSLFVSSFCLILSAITLKTLNASGKKTNNTRDNER